MPSTDPRPGLDSPRLGGLTDVPEDAPLTPSARSPYFHHAVSGSATTFKPAGSATSLNSTGAPSRTPSAASQRTPSVLARSGTGRSASGDTPSGMATPRRQRSGSPATVRERDNRDKDDKSQAGREREGREGKGAKSAATPPTHRIRNTPHLPHAKDVELAPATLMHWSRGPVFGAMPLHGTRAHTVTLIDNIAWMFGGCDERGCWQDVFCFNTETMQWTHPDVVGDIPPPCRAHTATLVDRKIIVFGGGEGPAYYNDLYILDTATRKWSHPVFPADSVPPPRRAHTSVLYKNKLWIFGGGNGSTALNDVWTLDVSGSAEKLRWDLVETRGKKPTARGYHTANLIGNVMVVVGGSDGRECFHDIWCLNLDTLLWSVVKLVETHKRLSHTATQVGSYLFIYGGHDGASYMSDLLLFNLVSLQYESRAIAGRPPAARGYHAACLADSRMFVFGGFNGLEVFDDVHILDLAGAAYLPQVTSFRIDVE
ncbi:galactose oxidase [Polyporus arcularius HHB13444]|uniref:Galactose oxidase n=1 Tax=Polyporus arcularius HHB13444 TaxID=1314778 RepID=A0A5C3NZF1_9APHY|nr:galactose oxidase [Polyporus arcularius HHB13444]